jgi:hypothetical protein
MPSVRVPRMKRSSALASGRPLPRVAGELLMRARMSPLRARPTNRACAMREEQSERVGVPQDPIEANGGFGCDGGVNWR